MAASKLEIHASPLVQKIATKFQRLYLCFWGSSYPTEGVAMPYDKTGRNRKWKIQDGGPQTWYNYILACTRESDGVSSAVPMTPGSSYAMEVMAMLYDQTGRNRRWEIQDGGMWTWNTFISACIQDSNAIPTAITMFSGSSYPMRVLAMLYDRTGRNRKWEIQDGGM